MPKLINTILLSLLFLIPYSLNAQKNAKADTVYLDIEMNEIKKTADNEYLLIHVNGKRKRANGFVELRDKSGLLIESVHYNRGTIDGPYYKLLLNSNSVYNGQYKDGQKSGTWLLNSNSGDTLLLENYDNNGYLIELVTNAPNSTDFKIYESNQLDELASYPGGTEGWNKHLQNNLKYPVEATRGGYSGAVFTELIILPDGVIAGVKDVTVENVHPSLKKEAQRVILAGGQWLPGKIDKKPVASKMGIRIVFRLK